MLSIPSSKLKFLIVLNKCVSNDSRITLNYLNKAAGKLFQNFYCFRLCMLEFYGSHLWRCNLDVILFLERLAESLRTIPSSPGVQSAVFLCFRVILIRMSPQHVTSLWPLIITEMVLIFSYLEQELSTDSEEWR